MELSCWATSCKANQESFHKTRDNYEINHDDLHTLLLRRTSRTGLVLGWNERHENEKMLCAISKPPETGMICMMEMDDCI